MHRSRFSSIIIDCRTDDLEAAAKFWSRALGRPYKPDSDGKYMDIVTREDEPVVCNQDPPELPLDASEVSVRTDRVSIEYRRWLRELAIAGAAADPGPAIGAVLSTDTVVEEKAMVES